MTTRRFLFVDTELSAPPSPTGLPEGYAVVTKDGHIFVIKNGVFKAASGAGTTVAAGLPPATGTPVAIGGVTTPFFTATATTQPAGYQPDGANDVSQTYGETANPAPPTGVAAYTAITPKTGGSAYGPGFHVLYLDNTETRKAQGCLVTFLYRFDAPASDQAALSGALQLRVQGSDDAFSNNAVALFRAHADTSPPVGSTVNNFDEWKSASFYLPPAGLGQNLYLYTFNNGDEGEGAPVGRILVTDLYVTPFDVADTGANWYDDRTGFSYVYDAGWRWLADPYTAQLTQRASQRYIGQSNYPVTPFGDAANAVLPIGAGPVGPPTVTAAVAAGGKLEVGVTYYYVVTSVNNHGESLPSAEVSAAVTTAGQQRVGLSWAAVPGALGYRVYASTAAALGAGSEVFVTELDASALTYNDGGYDRLASVTPPAADTTAGGTDRYVLVPGLVNAENSYRGYAYQDEAGINNYQVTETTQVCLSVKHDGVLPDLYLKLVSYNRVTGVTGVIADLLEEDLTSGKFRIVTFGGAYKIYQLGEAVIDYYVLVKSTVPGNITVRAGSAMSMLETLQ